MDKVIGVVNKIVYYNETNGYGIVKIKMDYKNPELAKYRTTLFTNILSIYTLSIVPPPKTTSPS